MRVFKRKRTDAKTGKTAESGRWYVTWADALNGLRHTWPAYTDKRASAGMGRKLEAIGERRASGEQLDSELRDFIDSLPEQRRQELVDLHLIERAFVQRADSLRDLLDRWGASMADRTPKHRKVSRQRVERILEIAGIDRLARISIPKLNNAIDQLAKPPHSLKPTTRLSHRQSLHGFLKWASGERLIPTVNLGELKAVRNAKAERERSALTLDEQRRLLATTAAGVPYVERARGGAVRNQVTGRPGRWCTGL